MWSVGRLFRLLNLSWSQDVRKTPPRSPRPQDASWDLFLMILGSNFLVFRSNLSDFRPPTWWIVQPTNKPNSQSANQATSQRNHTSRHPFIPGPGAGWPKAIGSAAPAGVQGVFRMVNQSLPTTKTYSLTKPTDLYGLLLVKSGLSQSARGGSDAQKTPKFFLLYTP